MNHTVVSRERLIGAAREIASAQGLANVSMRRVAAACGIAVGSIYNYFPTKADLVVAVIEDFWHTAIHGVDWPGLEGKDFLSFFEGLFSRLSAHLDSCRENWLEEITRLDAREKQKGKQAEAFYFRHMREGMRAVLLSDPGIPLSAWGGALTPEGYAAFALETLLALLKHGAPDCRLFLEISRRTLYRPGGVASKSDGGAHIGL